MVLVPMTVGHLGNLLIIDILLLYIKVVLGYYMLRRIVVALSNRLLFILVILMYN